MSYMIIEPLIMRVMSFFYSGKDEKFSAEESLRVTFCNVCNALLMANCFVVGMISLFSDDVWRCVPNLVLTCGYLAYFMLPVSRRISQWVINFEMGLITVTYVVMFMWGGIGGHAGIVIISYPFVSMMIQGRRTGVINSVLLVVGLRIYSLLPYDIQPVPLRLTRVEMLTMCLIYMACLFVFYTALRGYAVIVNKLNERLNLLGEQAAAKDDTIRRLTQHLQSPIDNINRTITLMNRAGLDDAQRDNLSTIYASAQTMAQTLHEASRADADVPVAWPADDKPFSLYTLLNNTLSIFSDGLFGKRYMVVLSPDVPTELNGNSVMTKQIFLNLLNAVGRFATHHHHLSIKVTVTLENTIFDAITLRFTIDVAGLTRARLYSNVDVVATDDSNDQFVSMFQLHQTARMIANSGHQLRIDADNGRTIATFALPFRIVHESVEKIDTHAQKHLRHYTAVYKPMQQARLLVAENNTSTCRIIQMYLAGRVADITFADNGREALRLFENSKYDLVLADTQMPVMDGLQMARKIREAEIATGVQTPIIAITANADADEVERFRRAGINSYITKPFVDTQLLSAVSRILEN